MLCHLDGGLRLVLHLGTGLIFKLPITIFGLHRVGIDHVGVGGIDDRQTEVLLSDGCVVCNHHFGHIVAQWRQQSHPLASLRIGLNRDEVLGTGHVGQTRFSLKVTLLGALIISECCAVRVLIIHVQIAVLVRQGET